MVYVALRACAHGRKQGVHAAGFHVESRENRVFGWEAVLTAFSSKACFDTRSRPKAWLTWLFGHVKTELQ